MNSYALRDWYIMQTWNGTGRLSFGTEVPKPVAREVQNQVDIVLVCR